MESFFELAKNRYSVRAYKDTPIEEEKLHKILEAGLLAPTARNGQPQKIYVVKSKEKLEKLAAVTPCTFHAPVVFVICYDEDRACSGKVCPGYCFGDTDAAIVGSPMVRIRTRLFCFAALICCVILAPNTTVCVVRLPCI